MADSLRDQLLKSGLVQKLKAEAKPASAPQAKPARSDDARRGPPQGRPGGAKPGEQRRPGQGRPAGGRPGQGKPAEGRPAAGGEPDLAQAYALRARSEREDRERSQREAEQKAREKREKKEQVARLLNGKALNVADAEHARHFEHGGKIRRVYCTQDQLAALNKGELAVVQQNGRYLLVGAELAQQVKAVSAEALVLLVDPNAPVEDDVPADLIW
ncbi:DUF2058 family protein [Tahibacter harae]|uniref:DUF2058 family protein n=1 Tax=Tahibacter harae TaxID=2963937 RepID=A0ABT1QNL8_9GAMM|nr:DUF2058 family protein [Tahibacter harae]MCQ4163700.1 DUF2058 family protein [Tahibacter harae]